MISPMQCRMARGALGWSIDDLARAARVGASTIARFEHARGVSTTATLTAITQALEAWGIEFLPANGVRFHDFGGSSRNFKIIRVPDGTFAVARGLAAGGWETLACFDTESDALVWLGEQE
jgi:transcriptional regulator with XRE-family HTH domain